MPTTTLTPRDIEREATEIFDEVLTDHGETLAYLTARWQDEHQYEDWGDYERVIGDKLASYNVAKILKVGAVIRTQHFDIRIKVGTTQASFKVLKVHVPMTR